MGRKIVGIGGIGRGLFFRSHEDRILGRNESRMAERLDIRDYCKLHIVFHYIARFVPEGVGTIPCGYIGDDAEGAALLDMMRDAGMDVSGIEVHPSLPTMLSVCLQYPDGSGCNITSSNSACAAIAPEEAARLAGRYGLGAGDYAVALPEVPIEARASFLKAASEAGSCCIASFLASEAEYAMEKRILDDCDIVALNQDETAAFSGMDSISSLEDAADAAERLLRVYPHLRMWLTVGAQGSISADSGGLRFYGTFPMPVASTAGAGDATLGGIIAALAAGLPFQSGTEACRWDGSQKMDSAAEFGALLGGLSVKSMDSIDLSISPDAVVDFINGNGWHHGFARLLKKEER